MKIWKQTFSLEGLDSMSSNTLVDTLGIKFIDYGDDFLLAEMPVNQHTVQPMRILHGGASVALAETVGSIASVLCVKDPLKQTPVGLDINANHLKSVQEGGKVFAKVSPIHLGRKTHVWHIDIHDEKQNLVCVSRLTMMILHRP